MKNYMTLEPDVYRLMNKHFTRGRNGARVQMVVIHHNAGVLSVDQIWNVWQTRQASAHYQVTSSGQTGQLVPDNHTAWHAANSYINQRSIGIEVSNSGGSATGWPISAAAREESARLTAGVHHHYKLGRPRDGVTVRYHREFTSTSCPYHLAPGGKYHREWWNRVMFWYDTMALGNTPSPTPAPGKENEVDKAQADRIETGIRLVLEQLAGLEVNGVQEFNGWPQGGQRTQYDLLAAIAKALDVPGTEDTKASGK